MYLITVSHQSIASIYRMSAAAAPATAASDAAAATTDKSEAKDSGAPRTGMGPAEPSPTKRKSTDVIFDSLHVISLAQDHKIEELREVGQTAIQAVLDMPVPPHGWRHELPV